MAKLVFTRSISKASTSKTAALIALFVSAPALAHNGGDYFSFANSGGELLSGFLAGITHPLTGIDHLMMLIGVGLIAASYKQSKQRSTSYGLLFGALFCMLLGLGIGLLSASDTGADLAGGIEQMILASVFVAASTAVVAASNKSGRGRRIFALLSVASTTMLIFHGWVHGLEASSASLMVFAPGMLLSASLLSGLGYQLGRVVTPKWQGALLGASGVLLAITG
ncbi:HupE/UreJ family protein [uncultured Photobacterium sp.]|uniref:HupE/UreJ family protein n=1 Tax=uncultured Photobacterium sp. TaxID=173973 RepID=UPI00260D8111|nr:HupE/UreJ family protein [uncultured Photobacterium sp.]